MITHVRNIILTLAVQALVLQACLNYAIAPKFSLESFNFGEAFLICLAVAVLMYDIRLTLLLNSVNNISNILSGIGKMQFDIAALNFKRLTTMQETLTEINMKLKDVKPLDVTTLSVDRIAKKHGVPVEDINKQLKIGIEVEAEHTTDKDVAKEIAFEKKITESLDWSKLREPGVYRD